MAVNSDYSEPLIHSSIQEDEDSKPVKHSLIAWIAFILAVLAVIAAFFYSLSYSVMNTYTQPVPSPFVTTNRGNVSGYWDPTTPNLAVFRGIPYADQPSGTKRWKRPGYPAPSWTGTKVATTDGKICWQFGARQNFPNQDEECLNLNVWTSNLNNATGLWDNTTAEPLPTLFWIYGGSNVYGGIDMYRGLDNWARKGNMCLVAPNYRLNAFGYLSIKELSQNDTHGASGNYGIADIQAALQWVQDNVGAFGCDPNRVTLFGQSSGGTNILALLASPQSKGLFHRAISLSGSDNITMNLDQANTQNRDIVKSLNCDDADANNVLTCLYSKSPAEILAAIPNDPHTGWAFTDFWPTDPNALVRPGLTIVDGYTVVLPLTDALAAPIIDVSLILQNNRDELELFWQAPDVVSLNASAYNDYLVQNFAPWPYKDNDGNTVGQLIAAQYQNITDVSVPRSYYDLNSDIGIYCANLELGKIAATNFRNKVYVSAVFQPPSHNISTDPNVPDLSDPIHLWDWIAATGSWNFFESSGGSVFAPNASQPPVSAYIPSELDLSLQDLLNSQFTEFIVSGNITNGMTPFNIDPDFPNTYNVAVQGDATGSGKVVNTLNFRSEYCNLLKTVGIEPNGAKGPINDGRFWWLN